MWQWLQPPDAQQATAYIPSLKTALEKVENMILSASNYVKQAAQEQSEVDEKSSQKDKD